MNRTLLEYDLRKVSVSYLLCLSVWTAYVLIRWTPFRPWDPGCILFGMLVGVTVAIATFAEPDGTEVWIVTRGLTRGQIFWNRLGLGALLILIGGAVSLGASVFGLRPLLHGWNAAELSVVRWFELNVTVTFLLAASVGFCGHVFLFVLMGVASNRHASDNSGRFTFRSEFMAYSTSNF